MIGKVLSVLLGSWLPIGLGAGLLAFGYGFVDRTKDIGTLEQKIDMIEALNEMEIKTIEKEHLLKLAQKDSDIARKNLEMKLIIKNTEAIRLENALRTDRQESRTVYIERRRKVDKVFNELYDQKIRGTDTH